MKNYIAISDTLLYQEKDNVITINLSELNNLQAINKNNNHVFLLIDISPISRSYKDIFFQQLVEFGLPLKQNGNEICSFTKENVEALSGAEKPIAILSNDDQLKDLAAKLDVPLLNSTEAKKNVQTTSENLDKKKRTSKIIRNTLETKIEIELNLDGTGIGNINTGLHFFDHMLHQLVRHGNLDLNIKVDGDLEVDEHHTIEDTALALGAAFVEALGNKMGIERYGFMLPMDDCLAQVAIDFGGRPWMVWDANFQREKIGDMPTEMFFHFFKSFSDAAKANLNIKAEGTNEHHKIESIFKAFAKAIKMAVKSDGSLILPTTKGTL